MNDMSIQLARKLKNKFETLNRRSAEVSFELRRMADGQELYAAVQAAEGAARSAGHAWAKQYASNSALKARAESARKRLESVCTSTVRLTEAFEISGAADVLTADARDDGAMAINLIDFARQIPELGEALATMLASECKEWRGMEAQVELATAELEQATRVYGHAFYRLTAVVAQGKAFLTAVGVRVPDRQIVRKKVAAAPPVAANDNADPIAKVA